MLPAAAECDSLPDGPPTLLSSLSAVFLPPLNSQHQQSVTGCWLLPPSSPRRRATGTAGFSFRVLPDGVLRLYTTCGAGRRRTWTARLCLRGLLCSVLQ